MNKHLNLIANLLLWGLCVFSLYHIVIAARYGSIEIKLSSTIEFVVDVAILGFVIGLAAVNIVDYFRGGEQ